MMYDEDQEDMSLADEEFQSELKQINSELLFDREKLEEQVEHIKLIEQKLNLLICDIELANNHIQTLLQTEKDPQKKKNLHTAISYNIEKLTKLYGVLREYQDTKYKYLSTIADNTLKKNKLIHVDFMKDKKGIDDSYVLFNKLISVMNTKNSLMDDIDQDINSKENYKI